MKVAVSSTGKSIDSFVDPRFGRCHYLLIVDPETMAVETLSNASVDAGHGAGIGTAQAVASTGAKVVLTGNVGPNAHAALKAVGITVYTGVGGTVAEAIERLKRGELHETLQPTVGGHHGMRRGMGGGRSRGMGRGGWSRETSPQGEM